MLTCFNKTKIMSIIFFPLFAAACPPHRQTALTPDSSMITTWPVFSWPSALGVSHYRGGWSPLDFVGDND